MGMILPLVICPTHIKSITFQHSETVVASGSTALTAKKSWFLVGNVKQSSWNKLGSSNDPFMWYWNNDQPIPVPAVSAVLVVFTYCCGSVEPSSGDRKVGLLIPDPCILHAELSLNARHWTASCSWCGAICAGLSASSGQDEQESIK